MSSINPHFTFHYSQPEEYRFSHDSVFLARRVFEMYTVRSVADHAGLDLCSGCGIVGLDFLFHCAQKEIHFKSFDFLEVQELYRPHFLSNCENAGVSAGTQLQFLNRNYDDLRSENFVEKYDLILCNPPYFHQGQGKLSPSEFKNRCRFFIDSNFTNLLKGIENALKTQGQAFMLLRDQKEHGWDAFKEARHILSQDIQLEKLEEIRGTDLVLLTKAPRKK